MSSKLKALLLFCIFVGGYASLSLELIVLRQLSSFVGNTSVTASIIIGIVLAMMAIGYWHGSILKISRHHIRHMLAKAFLTSGGLAIFAASFLSIAVFFEMMYHLNIMNAIARTFIFSFVLLSYTSYLFGKIASLISRYFHQFDKNYTGKILATDTIGSFLGSILTTLIIMPFLGINYAIILLVCLLIMTSALFAKQKRWLSYGVLIAITIGLNNAPLLKKLFGIVENNAVSTIIVQPQDNGLSNLIMINGSLSAKLSQNKSLNFDYIRYLQETFIDTLPHDQEKEILILGAGGFTLGQDDTFHHYTYIDIEKSLKPLTEQLMQTKLTNNKTFIVQDANQFLRETSHTYDLIILDVYSSHTSIPMDLVTKEFYERVRSHLKPNGIMTANIVQQINQNDVFAQKINNTLNTVFAPNLFRTVIHNFNPWIKTVPVNVIYYYYHTPNNGKIYNINKNTAPWDALP